MCRMLIAVGKVRIDRVIDDFLQMAGDKNERHENNENEFFPHGDGWGFVYLDEGQLKIDRAVTPCYEDERFLRYKTTQSPFYIMHARKTSQGNITPENVHAFHHSGYVFCHNGTVKEKLSYDAKFLPQGETDSERLFYHLLSNGKGKPIDEYTIRETYAKIRNYSGLNTIISDGEMSYIVNWYSKNPLYYTMKVLRTDEFTIISSEILPHLEDKSWRKLENREILKLKTSTADLIKC